jgi:hypothetical protein
MTTRLVWKDADEQWHPFCENETLMKIAEYCSFLITSEAQEALEKVKAQNVEWEVKMALDEDCPNAWNWEV